MLYEYDIKKSGIHCRYTQDIPEVCYQVARGIGWFGVLVCFIALFYIGPLAFFGMGASALLSFKQVNFRKEFQEKFIYFDNHMMIFDIVGNNKFYLTGNPDITNEYLFGSDDKLSIINRISDSIPLIDKYELKKEKEYNKHPVMKKLQQEYWDSLM